MEAGAIAFLSKPFKSDHLLGYLDQEFAGRLTPKAEAVSQATASPISSVNINKPRK